MNVERRIRLVPTVLWPVNCVNEHTGDTQRHSTEIMSAVPSVIDRVQLHMSSTQGEFRVQTHQSEGGERSELSSSSAIKSMSTLDVSGAPSDSSACDLKRCFRVVY